MMEVFFMEEVVLVDERDKELGLEDKYSVHTGLGKLHRAMSVWVINGKGEVLITKRSREKRLWPRFWSNTVCSHPRQGEDYEEAGERRLQEELGFSCRLRLLFTFSYHEEYKNVGSEFELCGVLVGIWEGKVNPCLEQVEKFRWVRWKELCEWSDRERNQFTPWFFLEKERLEKNSEFKNYIREGVV
jgi:isopentenyl-diphosphate delta-isomerase